jgi:hypothetical protein
LSNRKERQRDKFNMARLILMRKGHSPEELNIKERDTESVKNALERVWNGELDGILVMRQ